LMRVSLQVIKVFNSTGRQLRTILSSGYFIIIIVLPANMVTNPTTST